MPDAQPTSIIDLIAPPKGYDFHAGIWLTHDLDWSTLCDVVAPALTNVTTTGERRMHDVRAAVSPDVPGLLVLHAGGHHFTGGPALPWARELAVPGRRQHAKAALLLYRSKSGRKARTKAFVASANLTRSGLTSNLEVVTWDERGASSKPFIGGDLIKELSALLRSVPGSAVAKPVLKALKAALKDVEPTGMIVSSLVAPRAMVPGRRRGEPPASSIVIVSPSFAGNTDTKAAAALAPWCGPKTNVDIYVPFRGPSALAASGEKGLELSKGLLSGLKKTGAKVTVRAIPDQDDEFAAARQIHAKFIAVTRANGTTVVLSGSANCTGPGLEGGNREIMIRQERTARQLATFLDELNSVPFAGPIDPPPPKVPNPIVTRAATVIAVLEIDPTARPDDKRWSGTLTVTVEAANDPVKVTYNGRAIAVGVPVPVEFDPTRGTIEVRASGRSHFAQVHVEAPATIGDFWNRLTPERRIDRPDPELVRLLRDLDRPPKPPKPGEPGPKKPPSVAADDGFSIPLGQRLVLLARARRRLRGRRHDALAQRISDYLDARTDDQKAEGVRAEEVEASQATVLAIFGAYDPQTAVAKNPLLRSLQGAVDAFDRMGDEQQPHEAS